MATWNTDKPALANQISADVPDIEENLQELHDVITAITNGTLGTTAAASFEVDVLATGAIDAKGEIANDMIDSQHYVDGSIDTAHIADAQITTAKITDANVTTAKIANNNVTTAKIADANITQGKLKTSTGSVSETGTSYVVKTLPGGSYGFYPQAKSGNATVNVHLKMEANTKSTSYTTLCSLKRGTEGATTVYAQQRYVASSGEIFWIFVLRDKVTKEITSMWQAPDHPCFGNGGKPQLISHPFPDFDPAIQEIIVITPDNTELKKMQKKCAVVSETEPDKDLLEIIAEEYEIDEKSNPSWPDKKVTIGLPTDWDDAWISGKPVEPIKKKIPKPKDLLHKELKLKK